MIETHEFSTESKFSGYCGDHYCTGHTTDRLNCSCGYSEVFVSDKHEDKLKRKHKELVIAERLGLEFKDKDR